MPNEGNAVWTGRTAELHAVALKAARAVAKADIAEHAAQDTMADLAKSKKAVGIDNLNAYVGVMARNRARRLGGKAAKEVPVGRRGSEPPAAYDAHGKHALEVALAALDGTGLESLGSAVARRLDFEKQFNLLDDAARELLYARFVEGWDGNEMAAKLGIKRATLDKRVARAKEALLELVEDMAADL